MTNKLGFFIFLGMMGWYIFSLDIFSAHNDPYGDRDTRRDYIENVYSYGVSAVHPLAVEAGMQVLENGGNAVDAAIAISFVLGVVEPYGSGLGGGGTMLIYDPDKGVTAFDYRDAAPFNEQWTLHDAAIPGMVSGMETIHQNFGTMEFADLMEPAIRYSEDGFVVSPLLSKQIAQGQRYVKLGEEEREVFYPDGKAIEAGEILVQTELAETLRRIQSEGAKGFYEGETAKAMIEKFHFTEEDFQRYEVHEREPATGTYGDYTVYSGPAPTSGVTLIQILQMTEYLDVEKLMEEKNEALYIHLISEVVKEAYRDRLFTLGDPEFEEVDHEQLTSTERTEKLLNNISSEVFENMEITAYSESDLFDSRGEINDSRNTSHFVVIDSNGRMVSATHSLGEFFGSGEYVNGFFMNNQRANFSETEGSINESLGGKRPRSFIAPTIFEKDGQAVLGIGSPGGRRIPALLAQTILQVMHGKDDVTGEALTLNEAIQQYRFYTEDNIVYLERDLDKEVKEQLREMGYSTIVHQSPLFYGGIQALWLSENQEGEMVLYGGADDRRQGYWDIEVKDKVE
ncbi:gamma-glutamyltransferase family protein [Evansella vedderi]|nr:gamma-glutamyltransferase family protein [Evansella vedderi]